MNAITKMLMLISLLVLVIGGGFSFYFTYQGYQPATPSSGGEDGIAIDGFDAVAYHTTSVAKKGVYNFQMTWAGAEWHFSSLENQQLFAGNPEKYAPQFGGYDPYGMAINGTAQAATPELWRIDGGKLFLFYSGKTRELWYENETKNLAQANQQWTKLKQQFHYKSEMAKKDPR